MNHMSSSSRGSSDDSKRVLDHGVPSPTTATKQVLRHDEQENEDYYDRRWRVRTAAGVGVGAAAACSSLSTSTATSTTVGTSSSGTAAEHSTSTSVCSCSSGDDDDDYSDGRGHIQFSTLKLYGRDDDLKRLKELYQRILPTEEKDSRQTEGDGGETGCSSNDCNTSRLVRKVSLHSTEGSNDDEGELPSSPDVDERRRQQDGDRRGGSGQVVFIPGYSGSGKSALVREFQRQTLQDSSSPCRPWFISGKHDEHFKADPYSSIAEGISRFFASTFLSDSAITDQGDLDDYADDETRLLRQDLNALRERLNRALGDHSNALMDIIPNLGEILGKTNPQYDGSTNAVDDDGDGGSGGAGSSPLSLNISRRNSKKPSESKSADMLKQVFRNFMTSLCTKEHPVVLFLDDLQWMDEGTMGLISGLLADVNLKHLLFIGSYRSNEVDGNDEHDHPVSILMADLKEKGRPVTYLHLQDLSLEHIGEFIADSLNMEIEEVQPLTTEIHSRALGNIFFTMQALEELVRRNSLYYDMMTFQWQWNLSKLEKENHLSADIATMIRSKLMKLPKSVRHILTVASYTRSTVDMETLWALVGATIPSVKRFEDFKIGLDKAVSQGLMILRGANATNHSTIEYSFAHDLIQEASQSLVSGRQLNLLRLGVANVLEQRFDTCPGGDWMLFAAIHHLNGLPVEFLTTKDENAMLRLAQLNLRAAKLAIDRSAFRQAVELLRSGAGCLDSGMKARKWSERYELCLDLFNHLLETEFFVGNHGQSQLAVNEVLENAHYESDKLLAQFYNIELCVSGKDRSYERAVEIGLECLKCHGITIPIKPSDTRLVKERLSLHLVQGRRSLLEMLDGPQMDINQEKVMRLFPQLSHSALHAGNINLCTFVNITAMRRSWENGMNRYLPDMLVYYGTILRKQGKWAEACKIGFAAEDMLNKACEGSNWVRGIAIVIGGVIPMCRDFSKCVDKSANIHRTGVSCGDCWFALCGAMHLCFFHFCAGLPVHAMFEAKILHFEGQVESFRLSPSLLVTFQVFRQTVLNLRGKGGSSPTSFQGKALHETTALELFEGDARGQTLRDISIFRLMLACVYGDESCMRQMIVERFSPHPESDLVVSRQHLRDLFLGLAAFFLAKSANDRKYSKMLIKLGRSKLNLFQKLSKIGSLNAPPVVLCLKAVEKPTQDNYDKAIAACSASGLVHLEAIMSEWCGLFLSLEVDAPQQAAESYLVRAMWAYHDWGAMGKVDQMKGKRSFLLVARRDRDRHNFNSCVPPISKANLTGDTASESAVNLQMRIS